MEIDKDTMDKLFTGPSMLTINGKKILIGRNFLGINGGSYRGLILMPMTK